MTRMALKQKTPRLRSAHAKYKELLGVLNLQAQTAKASRSPLQDLQCVLRLSKWPYSQQRPTATTSRYSRSPGTCLPECDCRGRTQRRPEGGYFERRPSPTTFRSPGTGAPKEVTLKKQVRQPLDPQDSEATRNVLFERKPKRNTPTFKTENTSSLNPPCRTCRSVKKTCFAANLGTESSRPSTSSRARV